jgi:hypothetical protein
MVVADPIVSQAARWRTYYKTQDFTTMFLKTESTPATVIMEDYAAHLHKSILQGTAKARSQGKLYIPRTCLPSSCALSMPA